MKVLPVRRGCSVADEGAPSQMKVLTAKDNWPGALEPQVLSCCLGLRAWTLVPVVSQPDTQGTLSLKIVKCDAFFSVLE